MCTSVTWKDDKLVYLGGQEKKSDNKIHTHTHECSELLILPCETRWMGPAFLVWLAPRWQAHYSRVSGDLGVKVISANSLQLSVPLTALPEQHKRHVSFKSWIPQGAACVPSPVKHFWVTERHLGTWQAFIFCPTTTFPEVSVSAAFKCSDI